MIFPTSSALSAVSAFQKRMEVTADNVANVDTDEFKKSRVTMTQASNGGVKTTIQKITTPGPVKETIRNGTIEDIESSNVDLAEALTDMIVTKAGYTANLKTVKTQNELLGSLLNISG
jgi:flagellar hook protein FlgE